MLGLRCRVGDYPGTRLNVCLPILEHHGPQGDARVAVAVEAEVSHGSGIDAAFALLELVDDLHGPDLGRAAHGAGGERGPHDVIGGAVLAQGAVDVGDDVHDVAVLFDRHEVADL